jgi:hypothetical protein
LELFKKDDLVNVPRQFFGKELFDKELPDLVIFIDKTGKYTNNKIKDISEHMQNKSAKFGLIKRNKIKKNLFGQKFVYIMIFMAEEEKDCKTVSEAIQEAEKSKHCDKKTKQFTIYYTSDDWSPGSGEFVLFSVVKMIAQGISTASIKEVKKEDETYAEHSIPILEVGSAEDNTYLYYGFKKLPLRENTLNRVVVRDPDDVDHVALFGNYSGSSITSSVGIVSTLLKKDVATEQEINHPLFEPVLFGHLYIWRPELPKPHLQNASLLKKIYKRSSLSGVVGVRLSKDILSFDDIFVGVSIGHFLGPIGIVGGFNFKTLYKTKKEDSTYKKIPERREKYPFVGITLIL